jgi:hypothetical protein
MASRQEPSRRTEFTTQDMKIMEGTDWGVRIPNLAVAQFFMRFMLKKGLGSPAAGLDGQNRP